MNTQANELSFDELKDLAANDPAAFEAYRSAQIEAAIGNAPSHMQRRLRGIQFQVDAQRKIHNSPMGSCVKIYQMMQNSLGELNIMLNQQQEIAHPEHSNSGKVLSFPS